MNFSLPTDAGFPGWRNSCYGKIPTFGTIALSVRYKEIYMTNEKVPKETQERPISPRWGSTTKIVVGLSFIAITILLLYRFRQIIGPLFIAFILSYLLYPVATYLHRRLKISWRLASVILLLVLLIVIMGLLTLGGLAIFNQTQGLITFIQRQITLLPEFVETITSEPVIIGPFEVDLTTLNTTNLVDQILSLVNPILSNAASILGNIATGAAATIGWILFIILAAYFLLSDTAGARAQLLNFNIPGYHDDLTRMSHELSNIWNAFLRNQIILFFLTFILYIIVLGALQVNFYVGLALLAGLARFVPYVGPWVAWITYGLVAFFQGTTIFGLQPFPYVILVVGIAMLFDLLMDNFVVPRMMGDSLKIHPAAVMVAALIFAQLFGLIGVLLAAPVMATVKLISTYVIRKLFDLDPWEGFETRKIKPLPPVFKYLAVMFKRLSRWLKAAIKKKWPEGIPFVRWIKEMFHRIINKVTRKSNTPTT